MRTNAPMTSEAALASEHGWTLVDWDAAYEEACDSVEAEYLADIDEDDTDAREDGRKAVSDFVNNAWVEGFSHDEWVSAALRGLRR